MIYIKAFYGDWTLTTKEKAKKFCDLLMCGMTGAINQEHRIKLINKNHLKGIKYEKLYREQQETGQLTIFDFI